VELKLALIYTKEPNGAIKQLGGVLIAQGTAIKKKLLIKLHLKIFLCTAYLLNKLLT
jgi:hypothetical protein